MTVLLAPTLRQSVLIRDQLINVRRDLKKRAKEGDLRNPSILVPRIIVIITIYSPSSPLLGLARGRKKGRRYHKDHLDQKLKLFSTGSEVGGLFWCETERNFSVVSTQRTLRQQ